ncbi:MAG TPA: TrpB-like pyridoxal phosphate-dependent enzyme, partial [Prolixibacteraceae bacterium]|nr:TrpB-like pyridoxal phosphate-dependent enzyme [Prolixibacteraceae bacterium]
MVRVSFNQKPYKKIIMNTWGATCVASPSTETQAGRNILAEFPDTPGSLGIAISEAIEQAVMDPKGETRYSLGSVLNHVMLHQTIIGLETKKQLAKVGIKKPDVVVGCCGGGSNFAGLSFPFIYDKLHGSDIKIVGIEPFSCPTLTKAPFVYDHGDVARMTPLLPMYSLGHSFIPAPIHAGGLRYHGMAPLVSAALRDGLMEAQAVHQSECFEAGLLFAKTEGTIPAPETTHAIAGAIREAKLAKEEGKEKIIVFNFTGHGLLDLAGYEKYMTGQLTDYEYPEAEITKNLEAIKGYPLPK